MSEKSRREDNKKIRIFLYKVSIRSSMSLFTLKGASSNSMLFSFHTINVNHEISVSRTQRRVSIPAKNIPWQLGILLEHTRTGISRPGVCSLYIQDTGLTASFVSLLGP